jgi:8-amino-7-oxononanoate synthase
VLLDRLHQRSRERAAAGLTRQQFTTRSPTGRSVQRGADWLLNFASNDYLGLANHPRVLAAFREGLELYGAGAGASAMVSGHSEAHAALEAACQAWMQPIAPVIECLLFSNGYLANLAVLTALTEQGDELFCDKLNHASLIDAMRLSDAKHRRYPHGDLEALERQLAASSARVKLIVTDGVFSMDGDVAPLPGLLHLAERFDAYVYVDDAHGIGVLGDHGRGTMEWCGARSERLILMGTLGKAAGVAGAFVAAHPLVVSWLRQASRSYVYSTAPPPAASHALLESVALMQGAEGAQRRSVLAAHTRLLQQRLGDRAGLGWSLLPSQTAIQPLVIGDNAQAVSLARWLAEQQLWVPAIRPPTVPVGTARLRISLSADHHTSDVERLCEAVGRFSRAELTQA